MFRALITYIWTKVTGPNNDTALNMDTPDKIFKTFVLHMEHTMHLFTSANGSRSRH